MRKPDQAGAYIVGGGIASLSAAVLLVRDGGFRGRDVRTIEELPVAGCALDGSGDPMKRNVPRGGRIFTGETYGCLWNVLKSVPSLQDPASSVKRSTRAFNDEPRAGVAGLAANGGGEWATGSGGGRHRGVIGSAAAG